MSTNPFLIDSSCAQPSSTAPTFNPFAAFAADTTDSSAASNPFLQAFGSTGTDDIGSSSDAAFVQSTTSTVPNPFAQFFSAGDSSLSVQIVSDSVSADKFLLDDNNVTITAESVENAAQSWTEPPSTASVPPGPPRRPPPPRPSVAKETKDLILSVTGALEATSSDLLDRLQATRTPSPTPLRELNSPSPTAMYEVNDLLGDDDIAPPPPHRHGAGTGASSNIQQEASDIFDAIANLAKSEVHTSVTTTPTIPFSTVSTSTTAPVPPPSRPPPPQLPIQGIETDLSSLLDSRLAVNRTAGVSAPSSMIDSNLIAGGPHSKTELGVYTATRKASHDITATRLQPIPTRKKYSLDYSATSSSGAPLVDANAVRLATAPSPVMEDTSSFAASSSSLAASSSSIQDFPAAVPPPLTARSPPQLAPLSPSPPPPPPPLVADHERSDGGEILEVAKFPVISTTPLMSYENIANENLYEDAEMVPAPAPTMDVFAPVTSIAADTFDNDPFASAPLAAANLTFTAAPANMDIGANFSVPTTTGGDDEFDDFDQKFRNFSKSEVKTVVAADPFDPFAGTGMNCAANGENELQVGAETGFGNEAPFDEFLAMSEPPAASFGVDNSFGNAWPSQAENSYSAEPVESGKPVPSFLPTQSTPSDFFANVIPTKMTKTDSSETPPTPLFDEDVSQPLEPFPRTLYSGPGWEMQIRYPIRKKFTGQRFWKKVFVKLSYQGETPHLELVNRDDGKETLLHEWPLQPCYVISDIGAQQYDHFGKIFTVKIQFVVYKERPGVRPGQVTKAERLTNKLSQFAAYAIQGDYQGVKEFGSDLKKLGLPVEHSPQISLICKLGSHNYEDMKQFSVCVEDALFRLGAHRDNIHINYKMEEVQITAVDELYVEQNTYGSVTKQIARVRLFFLGFLTGMPDIDIGVNDLRRQGKEIVGRHDIIPVVTEEWIRLENVEFHSCVQQDVYEDTKTIKLKPPDACYLELMRFRVRPPKNRELPLQLKTVFRICGNKVDITADIMVPGFTSRKLGQIPCEDVAVRIPIPECWIYLFRVEKHFRYGSVKSAHRRTGKIKGIERFLGAVDTLETHLIEVTSGHAKYEHHHRAIVWRMARLPKEGQGAYTNHNLVCHLALTSYDQVPDELAKYCYVEFTMPITQVSHTTVRSVSISNSDSDSPPEKYVRHLARHEYRVEIEQTHAESTNAYIAATITKPSAQPKTPAPARQPSPPRPPPDSNSDSD